MQRALQVPLHMGQQRSVFEARAQWAVKLRDMAQVELLALRVRPSPRLSMWLVEQLAVVVRVDVSSLHPRYCTLLSLMARM